MEQGGQSAQEERGGREVQVADEIETRFADAPPRVGDERGGSAGRATTGGRGSCRWSELDHPVTAGRTGRCRTGIFRQRWVHPYRA